MILTLLVVATFVFFSGNFEFCWTSSLFRQPVYTWSGDTVKVQCSLVSEEIDDFLRACAAELWLLQCDLFWWVQPLEAEDLALMKLTQHIGTCDGILLLYYTFNLFSITEGWTSFTNVKVGIFVDRLKPSETSLENYGPNIIGNFHRPTTLTNVSLHAKKIPLNGLSFDEITAAFCSDIMENNVTVIVLQTRRENFTQFVGNLASYFKIPVIESLMQAPQLGDKVGGIIHSLLTWSYFLYKLSSNNIIALLSSTQEHQTDTIVYFDECL